MLTFAIDLLSNESATGAAKTWGGGKAQFSVAGTLGGATVTLQVLGPDNVTWVSAGTASALTAAGVAVVDLPQGQVRAAVASGTPSGLYARLARVPQ